MISALQLLKKCLPWVWAEHVFFQPLWTASFLHLKTGSFSTAFLPRKCTEVSSAGPKAQGFSTQSKLVLFTCFLRCCSDIRARVCALCDAKGPGCSHPSSPFPLVWGVASGAAGKALVEEDYGKVRLLAVDRLALLPELVTNKIVCWASETKRTEISFMSWM